MNEAEAERERCAALCDEYADKYPSTERNARAIRRVARVLAELIRADRAAPQPQPEPVGEVEIIESDGEGGASAWIALDREVDIGTKLYAAAPQPQPAPMSEQNRLIAYSAAQKLRDLGYEWDGDEWTLETA